MDLTKLNDKEKRLLSIPEKLLIGDEVEKRKELQERINRLLINSPVEVAAPIVTLKLHLYTR